MLKKITGRVMAAVMICVSLFSLPAADTPRSLTYPPVMPSPAETAALMPYDSITSRMLAPRSFLDVVDTAVQMLPPVDGLEIITFEDGEINGYVKAYQPEVVYLNSARMSSLFEQGRLPEIRYVTLHELLHTHQLLAGTPTSYPAELATDAPQNAWMFDQELLHRTHGDSDVDHVIEATATCLAQKIGRWPLFGSYFADGVSECTVEYGRASAEWLDELTSTSWWTDHIKSLEGA